LGEKHPGENRVVGTFKTADLDLTDAQRHKLRVLARNRYNPTTDEVKIGTSRFTEQAQNKRYIGEVIRDLIKASKEGEDTFSDIPLDTRHIEPKTRRNKSIYPQYEFPKEWERPQDAPRPKQDLLSRITEESSWSKQA
jgi:small subunit ribosomal protein S35